MTRFYEEICGCVKSSISYHAALCICQEICVNILQQSLFIVDLIMLGYLGQGNIASAVLGQSIFNLFSYFTQGYAHN